MAGCVALVLGAQGAGVDVGQTGLSAEEPAGGWKLLFDGQSTKGWHSFKKETFPEANWDIQDGWLHCLGKGGGDIVSQEQFTEFDLQWEWKLSEGGNSGVKYFVAPDRGPIGHEYQILDDTRHPDGQKAEGKRLTAAFYDVLKTDVPTPLQKPGEINQSRVTVKDNTAQHWLNGVKVLEYQLGSQAVKEAVANSKFKEAKDFGSMVRGHILIQDHNDEVWFRNIRIRDLSGG